MNQKWIRDDSAWTINPNEFEPYLYDEEFVQLGVGRDDYVEDKYMK
jgi:hypothetical protein